MKGFDRCDVNVDGAEVIAYGSGVCFDALLPRYRLTGTGALKGAVAG